MIFFVQSNQEDSMPDSANGFNILYKIPFYIVFEQSFAKVFWYISDEQDNIWIINNNKKNFKVNEEKMKKRLKVHFLHMLRYSLQKIQYQHIFNPDCKKAKFK